MIAQFDILVGLYLKFEVLSLPLFGGATSRHG